MVGLSGIVADARILPVIENDIGRRGDVSIILYPAAQLLIEPDHRRTAALCGHDVSQAALQGYG